MAPTATTDSLWSGCTSDCSPGSCLAPEKLCQRLVCQYAGAKEIDIGLDGGPYDEFCAGPGVVRKRIGFAEFDEADDREDEAPVAI